MKNSYIYTDELDKMLKWFSIPENTNRVITFETFKEEYKIINASIEPFTLRNECILKLIKDDYITKTEIAFQNEARNKERVAVGFRISFEGLVFNEFGGYKTKIKKDSTLSTLQSVQTWAIVAGTVLAAIGTVGLLIFEFLKYFRSCC